MLRSITSRQFLEWQVFEQLEPFGAEREDYRTANVVRAMLNLWGWDRRKRSVPFELVDGLLRFGDMPEPRVKQERSWQDLKATAQSMSMLYNQENG